MSYSDSEESDIEDEHDEDSAMGEILDGCKYGDLSKVKEVVEREGDDYVLKRDKEGHTLVHWAALGGYNQVIEYLLEKGAPINEHSDNDYGPRPIHWACIHGHFVTVDLFLEKGVPVDTTDLNGCSPLIVAAQYGQSLLISYLLQKGANKFQTDINGDTALHWAAFKGQPEAVFLLLNAGLSSRQRDSFGQTPLHSACIKGDIQCAEMLMEHGGDVEDVDSNNKTPRTLAVGRRHRSLVKFLDTRDMTSIWDWKTILFGPPGRSYVAVLFFVGMLVFWAYPMYFYKAVPVTLEQHWNVHMAFWVFSVFLWIMFFWSRYSNPGYIPTNRQAYDEAIKMIGNPTAWGDYTDMTNPIFNLCHTCKTVRPVRAKHCRQCDKCVEDFDHHCPWIDNCIGKKNRVPFTVFLYVLMVNAMFTMYFAYLIVKIQGTDWSIWFGMTIYSGFFISGIIMVVFQIMMILGNLTTNEKANYRRYRHFRMADGKFRNPFDRGVWLNCLEYWNLIIPPYATRKRQAHMV